MLIEAIRRGATTLKVATSNDRAINFYRRHGWEMRDQEGEYLWLRAPQIVG
jgi:ribosomal protein S18 acetylase RimI-like enzyme